MPGALLHPVNPLDDFDIEGISPQSIDCVRRESNDTTGLKDFDGSINL
jgi:hypothetical protein